MEISYKVGALLARASVNGKRNFLLTNRDGSYYYHDLDTKHGGWFVHEQDSLFRVLAEIRIPAPKVSSIVHKLYAVEQHRGKLHEHFFLPFNGNALVYKTGAVQDIDLVFDVRKVSDDGDEGRFYDITAEDGSTIIKFTKKSDVRKPCTEFTFFVAVNAEGKALNRWEKRHYKNDGNEDFIRAVCRAVRFHSAQLVITAGIDRAQVLQENRKVAKHLTSSIAVQRTYAQTFACCPIEKAVASFALDSLTKSFSHPKIFSSVPQFFAISKDELISVKALLLLGERKLVWDILFRQLRSLQPDGSLPSASALHNLRSADASGWLFLRINDFMTARKLQKEECLLIEEKLVTVIEKLHERHSKNGLAWDTPEYTWMNSGARMPAAIEMQTLRLMMYKLAYAITKNSLYKMYEEQLRVKVRKFFWNGNILADGLADFTPRQNLFLAAYIYPELLSTEEWRICIQNALNLMWLDWGGLALIDKKYEQLSSQHDEIRSHHTDSLFWINNLAAIVMHRVDKKMFNAYVNKVYSASKEELLWKGCVGMPAALSSAKELTSKGDAASSLSAATFVELCHELRKKH